jgi:hypothetical protein
MTCGRALTDATSAAPLDDALDLDQDVGIFLLPARERLGRRSDVQQVECPLVRVQRQRLEWDGGSSSAERRKRAH